MCVCVCVCRGQKVKHPGGDLGRLKSSGPETVASSISGFTIFSVMSVSTVKVGSTMKSMNPGETWQPLVPHGDMGPVHSSPCSVMSFYECTSLMNFITI